MSVPVPPITVTRNGSSFDEFLPKGGYAAELAADHLPERFVLFVATVEGRKNHRLILDIWRRMLAEGDDPPHLLCVGRVGWKSEPFVAKLVETGYLDGRVILLQEVSDAYLRLLYSRCLFTVFPSLYEGWGLPVGESLAAGKICVCSNRASIPEVAGEWGRISTSKTPISHTGWSASWYRMRLAGGASSRKSAVSISRSPGIRWQRGWSRPARRSPRPSGAIPIPTPCTGDGYFCIVYQRIPGVDLATCIQSQPIRLRRQCAIRIVQKFQLIRELGLYWNDCRHHNILIDEQGQPFLIDFELSSFVQVEDNLRRLKWTMWHLCHSDHGGLIPEASLPTDKLPDVPVFQEKGCDEWLKITQLLSSEPRPETVGFAPHPVSDISVGQPEAPHSGSP